MADSALTAATVCDEGFEAKQSSAFLQSSLKVALVRTHPEMWEFTWPGRWRFHNAMTTAGQQVQPSKFFLQMSFTSCLSSDEGFPTKTLAKALSIAASGQGPKILRISSLSCL